MENIRKQCKNNKLKIIAPTWNDEFKGCVCYILLVCFVCLKESTCETRKNVFYFTSKAFFVLEIIKF